jgi:RHS repeat-associated protein
MACCLVAAWAPQALGQPFQERITGPVLAVQRGGVNYFVHGNPQGNQAALTSITGVLKQRSFLDDFGKVEITDDNDQPVTGAGQNPYHFQHQRYDAETGLHYAQGRYYQPRYGRYINRGRSNNLGNQWTYRENNPWWAGVGTVSGIVVDGPSSFRRRAAARAEKGSGVFSGTISSNGKMVTVLNYPGLVAKADNIAAPALGYSWDLDDEPKGRLSSWDWDFDKDSRGAAPALGYSWDFGDECEFKSGKPVTGPNYPVNCIDVVDDLATLLRGNGGQPPLSSTGKMLTVPVIADDLIADTNNDRIEATDPGYNFNIWNDNKFTGGAWSGTFGDAFLGDDPWGDLRIQAPLSRSPDTLIGPGWEPNQIDARDRGDLQAIKSLTAPGISRLVAKADNITAEDAGIIIQFGATSMEELGL